MTPEQHETLVVRRLRQCIGVVIACGALIIALGYVQVTVIDMVDYEPHLERAGSDVLSLFVVAMLLPAGWVYRSPRWPQLVMWIMWLTSLLMLMAFFSLGGGEYAWSTPPARSFIALAFGAIGFIVVVVMPFTRSTHKSPPRSPTLPSARVVR